MTVGRECLGDVLHPSSVEDDKMYRPTPRLCHGGVQAGFLDRVWDPMAINGLARSGWSNFKAYRRTVSIATQRRRQAQPQHRSPMRCSTLPAAHGGMPQVPASHRGLGSFGHDLVRVTAERFRGLVDHPGSWGVAIGRSWSATTGSWCGSNATFVVGLLISGRGGPAVL